MKPTSEENKVGFFIYKIKNKDGRNHQPGATKKYMNIEKRRTSLKNLGSLIT